MPIWCSELGQRFDFALEILSRDQIDNLDPVGQQSKEQTEVYTDALPHNVWAAFQAFCAAECGGVTAGQAPQHDHRTSRDMMGKLAEPVVEGSWKFDKADRMIPLRVLRKEQIVFDV